MNLSVCLPLHNAAGDLERRVSRLLDFLSELTDGFEIILVDDASTDATMEIAHEMSLLFPQVRVVCHGTRRGHETALRTAGRHARGDFVLLDDDRHLLELQTILTLWNAARGHDVVYAVRAAGSPSWRRGSRRPGAARGSRRRILVQSEPGPILVRRHALTEWIDSAQDRFQWIAGLPAKDYDWIALDSGGGKLRQSQSREAEPCVAEAGHDDVTAGAEGPASLEPRRPNYLKRLRDFALGE